MFRTFFFDMPVSERVAFATKAGTSRAYLTQVAYGNKRVDLGFADVLVALSGGRVGLDDLPLTERARLQHRLRTVHGATRSASRRHSKAA